MLVIERGEQIVEHWRMRGVNSSRYDKPSRPRTSDVMSNPLTEARSVLDLVRTGTMTATEARELIQVSRRELRELVAGGISREVIRSALDFRARVLTEFDDALRRQPVQLLDRFRRSEEREVETNQADARDARDVIAEERVCWSCGRLPSAHALDGHGFCRLCYPAEMNARSAAR